MSNSEVNRASKGSGKTPLFLSVEGKEDYSSYWEEQTETIAFSRLGASFKLNRKCQVGTLLALNFAMPPHLRTFDFGKRRYRVWGLVQICSEVRDEDFDGFQIGVAFVGEQPPESYCENPQMSFRINGFDSEGMWTVEPLDFKFKSRAYFRFRYPLNCRLTPVDRDGKEKVLAINAITENIGIGGTAVASNLAIETGEHVMFHCEEPSFSSLSVVRKRLADGSDSKLHLEFSEAEFPIAEVREPRL